jgi:hypothetical protein
LGELLGKLSNGNAVQEVTLQELLDAVRDETVKSLASKFGPFTLTDWSNNCFQYLWRIPAFPWPFQSSAFPNPARLELAMWVDGRLVGLAHVTLNGSDAVLIQAIEGDRDKSCPLKGKRAAIAIQAATYYAQALNRSRLLLQPMNEDLTPIYIKDHDFKDSRRATGSQYLWKEVPK